MADKFLNGIRVVELSSDPASPPSGEQVTYPKSDGKWYRKNSSGIVTEMTNTNDLFSGQVTINFGPSNQEDSYTITTVNNTNVNTSSIISIFPSGLNTTDHDSDDYQWDNISAYAANIINNTSFDVIGVAPEGSWGKYIMNYIIK